MVLFVLFWVSALRISCLLRIDVWICFKMLWGLLVCFWVFTASLDFGGVQFYLFSFVRVCTCRCAVFVDWLE